jgi:DUF4097 and DUF4098 domain-containing protein YvlB
MEKGRAMMFKLSLLFVLLTTATTVMFKNNTTQQFQAREKVREEFRQTYPLAAGARIHLKNVVGTVRITTWERNEVRVEAMKTAPTRQILDDASIKIESSPTEISILTKYPEMSNNEQAVVEYNLTVPRSVAMLDAHVDIASLYIDGVGGDVTASSINGEVIAHGLAGEARLSTINGRLEASFERLNKSKHVTLTSVNSGIILTLPPDASAEVWANSQHSSIKNDFGLQVQRSDFRGSALNGTIGSGGTRITLNNDYGTIHIRRARNENP